MEKNARIGKNGGAKEGRRRGIEIMHMSPCFAGKE